MSFFVGLLRLALFWAIPVALVAMSRLFFSAIDYWLVGKTIFDAIAQRSIERVSQPEFAYALAGILFVAGLGLALAFLLLHVLPVIFTLGRVTRLVSAAQGGGTKRAEIRRNFAAGFENLSQRVERNWIIGHAWIEFEETLFDKDSDRAISNTVRPQVFFNSGIARERLDGLKMMNAIPSYFVGIGLLLTFTGLVFALYKASAAASAGGADIMAAEMKDLLRIATFKFSTSIAGLAASILLSIIFRWFFVLIEGAFGRLNAALERGLLYAAPQAISMEINRIMQDQLVQLKDITQGEFFARMGSEIAPRLNVAIADAMTPVTALIGDAVGKLSANSQDGVQKMLQSFTDQLHHGAGTEMREFAIALKELQMSIVAMQGSLRGGGVDFAAKLSEAADNLSRMVERAGQTAEAFGKSADSVRSATQPLLTVSDKFSGATERMASAVEAALEALRTAQNEISVLAAGLDATNEKASAFWGGFTTKFDAVDTALGQAVDTLSRSTSEQQDRLRSHVQGVDQGLSEAIGKLAPFLAQIKESAEAIADSIEAARSSHGMTRP